MSALQNLGRGGNQGQGMMGMMGNQGNQGNMGGMNQMMNQDLKRKAEEIKRHYENAPNDLQYILHQNPEFAQAVLNDDIRVLMDFIKKSEEKKMKAKLEQMERIVIIFYCNMFS